MLGSNCTEGNTSKVNRLEMYDYYCKTSLVEHYDDRLLFISMSSFLSFYVSIWKWYIILLNMANVHVSRTESKWNSQILLMLVVA